jgi:hypothetical protein
MTVRPTTTDWLCRAAGSVPPAEGVASPVARPVARLGPHRFVRFGASWPVRPLVGCLSVAAPSVTPPPQLKLKAWGRGHRLRGDKQCGVSLTSHDCFGGVVWAKACSCRAGPEAVGLVRRAVHGAHRSAGGPDGAEFGDADARARGRLSPQAARRRVGVWRRAGLVRTQSFVFGDHATVWLTAEGMAVAGLPWRPYEPTLSTYAHRHARPRPGRGGGEGPRLDLRTGAPRGRSAAGRCTCPTVSCYRPTRRVGSGARRWRWS